MYNHNFGLAPCTMKLHVILYYQARVYRAAGGGERACHSMDGEM